VKNRKKDSKKARNTYRRELTACYNLQEMTMDRMYDAKVAKLLRLLGETSGDERKRVLMALDERLAFAGMSWADVADGVASPPPRPSPSGYRMPAEKLLSALDLIEEHPDMLSPRAKDFVAQTRSKAERFSSVYFSPAQFEWLRGLHRQLESPAPVATSGNDSNIVQFPTKLIEVPREQA
jgi:hypothetical protein